tara:strand:+ start:294 stop:440 length:147 start_codon:yes stop_codon:yes gene_type:complete
MTFPNAKRLYDHYVATGQTANAEDMAKNRPEVAKVVKVVEESKSKKEK